MFNKKIYAMLFTLCTYTTFSYTSAYSITDTNFVSYKYDEQQLRPIASLTKLMNIMVTLDAVKEKKVSLDDYVNISRPMTLIKETSIKMDVNDKIKLEDLLKAEIVHSANNAAYAVAMYVSNNNVDEFIRKMNEKAKQLGMKNTTFYTPTGLPTKYTQLPLDVSTAKDLGIMGLEALKYKEIIEWAKLKKININGYFYYNRNKLLGEDGNFGLKTGYHKLSGFNMIGAFNIHGVNLINVSLNDDSNKEKFSSQEFLTNEYLNKVKRYLEKGSTYGVVRVKYSKEKYVEALIDEDFYYYNTDYVIKEHIYNLKGSIKKNQRVGELKIYSKNNKLITTIYLISKTSTRKLNIFERILEFFSLLKGKK